MNSLQQDLAQELQQIKSSPIFTLPGVLEGPSASHSIVDGKKVIMFCSNNYHGLTTHPHVISRAREALEKYGSGLGSGRALASMKIQLELEEKISKFKGTRSTLTFQTGYDTNLSAVWALSGEGDMCICDEFNHASVFDGLKLSSAKQEAYPHRDMKALEKILQRSKDARRIFVITPSVFPLEGDIAPLPEIVELAEKYSAIVYTDDSHGVGVLGKNGAGIVEHFQLHGKVEIQVGTLSKALASIGGYVTGSEELREYLFRKARPFSQATGHIAPASAAAALAALEVLQEEKSLVGRLWSNAKYFRDSMIALGFDTGNSETPIVPIILGDEQTAAEFRKMLFNEGIYVQAFSYPNFSKNKAKLRTIVSSAHTREDLEFCLDAFTKVGKRLGVLSA
jgi:glycine C-acetyltransferase